MPTLCADPWCNVRKSERDDEESANGIDRRQRGIKLDIDKLQLTATNNNEIERERSSSMIRVRHGLRFDARRSKGAVWLRAQAGKDQLGEREDLGKREEGNGKEQRARN